ncbi:hypothetical protein [Ensifer adhaerens]|uniref:hypothetical protein n=1 Tax=Ensifer adhaerens TaxID=106592 RepID=UPI003F8625C8
MATVRAQSEKRGFIGHSTRLPFTELAIDPMRPECRHADRKHLLNRNPAALRSVTGFVWAASGTMKYRYG